MCRVWFSSQSDKHFNVTRCEGLQAAEAVVDGRVLQAVVVYVDGEVYAV